MSQPLIRLNSRQTGPIMHVAVANGFPPQTYIPLLRPFFDAYQVVSLPPRALWGDGSQPPTEIRDWRDVKDDLLAGMAQYGLRDVIAIGHSMGAIASLLSVVEQPERFKALILLDPTLLPEQIMSGMYALQQSGDIVQSPLVQGALRRHRDFESTAEAFERFKSKRLFRDWPDESLRFYAEQGTKQLIDRDGVELAWSPEWEAYYFSTLYAHSWQTVPQLNGTVPILVIRGGSSDTFIDDAENRMRDLLPDATYEVVPGHGHLFPQSAPNAASTIIANWLNA